MMKSLSTILLTVLFNTGANAQIVVTERIGYCGLSASSTSLLTGSMSSFVSSPSGSSDSSVSPSLTSSPSPTSPVFLVGFQLVNPPQLQRRQAVEGYVTPDGMLTSDCSASPILSVNSAGQLSARDGEIYSTSQGVDSAPFTASTTPGDISTTWQLSNGTLSFDNGSFLNGAASICATNGSVEAYYLVDPPPTCAPGILTAVALSACPGIASSSAITGSLTSPFPTLTPTSPPISYGSLSITASSSNSSITPSSSLNSTSLSGSALQTSTQSNGSTTASGHTNSTLTPFTTISGLTFSSPSLTSTATIGPPFGNISTIATSIQQNSIFSSIKFL